MNPAVPRRKTGVIEKLKRVLLASKTTEEEACEEALDTAMENLKEATQHAGEAVQDLDKHVKREKQKRTKSRKRAEDDAPAA